MYTEKVMKYFKHPKNMGVIKNADAVGQVGNPTCLLPEEIIHKNPEIVHINKISKDDKVLTHTGDYKKVIAISCNPYKGDIIRLKNKLGKISFTPEHLVYAIKVPKHDKFLRSKNKKMLVPAWYHADQLEVGDISLYPIHKNEKDIESLKIDIPELEWDYRSKEIPDEIPVNDDLLRLFGYFLSEGNVQDKPCKTYISFSLNIAETDIVEDIRKICQNLFNLSVKVKNFPKRNTVIVYLYNARIARFFKKIMSNGAKNKKIPAFVMYLPKEKQKSLIFGLWKGDGYVNLERDGPRAGYSTISYQLAQQLKILLIRQKILPSIYEEDEKNIRGVNHKKNYRLHVGQRESLINLCKILNINYEPKIYKSIKSWFDNNFLYIPITKKDSFYYEGNVHNLEVIDSHSFVSGAFCLHNCGDVMKIYLKIGKDSKGREVIKDCKFETLGCIAAIATSSITTELAKGKTLDEAMKIDKKKVADSLGGLPAAKFHCSILAVDALKKAIENYRKK